MVSKLLRKMGSSMLADSKEAFASFFFSDVFHGYPYLPFTNSSLFLHSLLCVRNDLFVNKKVSVLEFGCGISTVVIARIIKKYNLNASIVSFEENRGWSEVIKTYLMNESLTQIAKVVHASTNKSERYVNAFCYDAETVKRELGDRRFDLILIDGPTAYKRELVNSRVPTIDLFDKNIDPAKCAIFLDNADRPGEKLLAQKIVNRLGGKKRKISSTFAAYTIGEHYNFIL